MYPELILVIAIIVFLVIYNKVFANGNFFSSDNPYIPYIKEDDYDFLLISKYGDRVYDANEVYLRRIKKGLKISLVAFLIATITGKMNFITILVCLAIGFFVYKSEYLNLKSYYKAHLNQVDSLLPYYLKGLEILIHHYTVPVALAKSIEDAPEIFKPGLKRMVEKIEAGDSSVEPYMAFAREYPVRDSMRMMRLLYRLGLGEQEKKHEQLISFSKSVSSLQAKAREDKYKARLNKMEKETLKMLMCTGGCSLILLLISIFSTMML